MAVHLLVDLDGHRSQQVGTLDNAKGNTTDQRGHNKGELRNELQNVIILVISMILQLNLINGVAIISHLVDCIFAGIDFRPAIAPS